MKESSYVKVSRHLINCLYMRHFRSRYCGSLMYVNVLNIFCLMSFECGSSICVYKNNINDNDFHVTRWPSWSKAPD